MRLIAGLMLLFPLMTPLCAAQCTVAPDSLKTLAPSAPAEMPLRLGQYRIGVPVPQELALSSGLAMLIYRDGRVISHQSVLESADDRNTPAALYQKIHGLAALSAEDDAALFDGLRQIRCGEGGRAIGYLLPGERLAVSVAHGDWHQVLLFTSETAVEQLDFRYFSDAEVEAILASLTRVARR